MDVVDYLNRKSVFVEKEIARVFPKNKEPREVYAPLWEFFKRGGKRFRPELCMLSCEAVGGKRQLAMPAAVAIELFHNFTLIHDDIEDDSEMRRGKPCLHRMYGVPLAINAGDGLFVLVWKALQRLKTPCEKSLRVHKILGDSFTAVLEGQGMELDWHANKRWNISERDYLRMASGKTGSLISASCEVGGVMGGGSAKQISALKDFGMKMGIAFQIQDDVLNLVGEEEKYKKEIGGDITEGKRSLIVAKALQSLDEPKRRRLLEILASGTRESRAIQEAIGLMRECGAIDYAQEKSISLTEQAKASLSSLPKSGARAKLLEVAEFFIKREF